jgi:group I intron endonuclease
MPTQIKRHYLYRIHCTKNQKNYIGQTISPDKRWYEHKRNAASEYPQQIVQCAIKKHGNENFEFEVIVSGVLPCTCEPGKPGPCQDDANETETLLVQAWESHISTGKGYNVTLGGINAPKTEEWRAMMSHKMTERWDNYSEEEKQERIGMLLSNPNIEWMYSEANKQQLQEQSTIRWSDAEQHRSMSAIMTERMAQPEEKEKRSQAWMGENNPRYGATTSGMAGKQHTKEAKEKNRQAHVGKRVSPATEFKPGHGLRIFSVEEQEQICRMYQTVGTRAIAAAFGTSREIVKRVLKENNIEMREPKRRGQKIRVFSTEEQRQICEMYQTMGITRIARAFRADVSNIRQVLKEHNVEMHSHSVRGARG